MPIDIESIFQELMQSGLVTQNDLQVVTDKLVFEKTTQVLQPVIEEFVKCGKISGFQATRLLDGQSLRIGSYVLIDKLAEGGMGQVFKARHQQMDRMVALKVIRDRYLGSSRAVDRFLREVKAVAKLSHPNVVTAFDAGEMHGVNFLVMEFIEGKNLAAYVSQYGPVSIQTAIGFLRQAAEGLKYIHSQGIVHRDIKPSNLLVDQHGVIKILDLGLARFTSWCCNDRDVTSTDLTATGEAVGTADYMSPEQAMNAKDVDHRSDIYSLGCTLYFLLAGKPPFDGNSAGQKLIAHRERPLPPLTEAQENVPMELDTIFRRMIAKHPNDRFASIQEVARALDGMSDFSAAQNRLVPTIAYRAQENASQAVHRRWRMIGILMALCAATLLVAISLNFFRDQRQIDERNSDQMQSGLEGGGSHPPTEYVKRNDARPSAKRTVDEAHRSAAKWALSRGGSVDLFSSGLYLPPVQSTTNLPSTAFRIYRMQLAGCEVFDDDLRTLEAISDLELLDLGQTEVTDEGLQYVGRIPKLQTLRLVQTAISDEGINHLSKLRNLEVLDLRGTRVTDTGIAEIARTHSLTRLLLGEKQTATNVGLHHLGQMQTLTGLGLRATKITDEGLSSLTLLKNLKWLDLGLTRVSDAGIAELEKLTQLEHLIIDGTLITDAGVKMLKLNCEISR